MDKSSELTTSNVLNKELKNALMSADSSIISVLINELKKFQDKEGVFDLINSLTEIQYEKSVNDMNSKFDNSVVAANNETIYDVNYLEQPLLDGEYLEQPHDDFDNSVSDMNSKFDNSVNDMNSKFDNSAKDMDSKFDKSANDKKDKNSGA